MRPDVSTCRRYPFYELIMFRALPSSSSELNPPWQTLCGKLEEPIYYRASFNRNGIVIRTLPTHHDIPLTAVSRRTWPMDKPHEGVVSTSRL